MTTKPNAMSVCCPACSALTGTACRGKRTHKERRAEAVRVIQRANAHDFEMALYRRGAPGADPGITAEDLAAVQEYARERGPYWRMDMVADWLFVRRPVWGVLIGLRARGNAWLWQSDFGV
jgi:hypothetical protein